MKDGDNSVKGRKGDLQTCQPHLCAGEDPPGNYAKARSKKEGI